MSSLSSEHVDELSASTKLKLRMLRTLSSQCSIYNVPSRMRETNEKHFTPRIISIGPIHYRKKKLMGGENLKERYLAEFLELSQLSLKGCLQLVLEKEKRLRNCYADVIELDSETFAKMVLVDAAFLVMILLCNSFGPISRSDRIWEKPRMMYEIRYDMMLLENQLPFFILEDLYKFSELQSFFDLGFDEEDMIVLACEFLKNWISPKIPERPPPSKADHILGLFRSSIQADWVPQREKAETTNMPSMEKLYQAGVKIKVGSTENMFDVKFHEGILEIPPIRIYDTTELMYKM